MPEFLRIRLRGSRNAIRPGRGDRNQRKSTLAWFYALPYLHRERCTMKTREQIDLENMALSAELSRQLGHDFSNFVYNLLLQVEIWQNLPKPQRPDWEKIK